jgi:hypothetical protein
MRRSRVSAWLAVILVLTGGSAMAQQQVREQGQPTGTPPGPPRQVGAFLAERASPAYRQS